MNRTPSGLTASAPVPPEKLKSLFLPSDDSIWLNNQEDIFPSRPKLGYYYPEHSIRRLELGALLASFQHHELLPEREVLHREISDEIQ